MKHHNISFNEIKIALFTETTDDNLQQYQSDFKVPVLKDDDLIIWDSLSILEYLSEKYPDAEGWPLNIQARSIARSMCSEMHSSFFNLRKELPMNCRKVFHNIRPSTKAMHEINRVKALWKLCRNKYGDNGDWLFGNFSIADAMYAPVALRFQGYNIPLNDEEHSYIQNLTSHPSIIEWIESARLEEEIIEQDEL